MDDSACASRATNTFADKLDEVVIAVTDLQNLAYIQQLMLSERMQTTSERDALLTLHYAFCDRLDALHKTCGTLTEAHSSSPRAGALMECAEGGSAIRSG